MALPLQFRDLCRACMKRRDDMRMFFFSRINSVDVASMLTKIALLPVEPSDSLPKVLCSVCIRKLNDAYNFQQMCIKSHITFNDMLQTQQWPRDVIIKKEPCELTISAVESQADVEDDKSPLNVAAASSEGTVFLEPKIEPGISEDSQGDSIKNDKCTKSAALKGKKFTCNFCRDVFETWNELTVHVAEHKTKSTGGDDSSCEVPEKKRKISQASTSKDVFPASLGFRIENFADDGGRSENSSLDGLPLEPICSVQVKEEINSDQSASEYEEEDNEGSIINKYKTHADEDEENDNEYQIPMKTEKQDGKEGRNFVNSKSPICEMCGFKPKIPALMHAHVRNRHPDNYMEYVENLKTSGEWVVKCRICDVYLFSSTIYGQHLKYTHSQIVNDCTGYFECNMCDQWFSSKNDFFLHKNQAHNMRRINKAKQIFMCLLCDKQFGRYSNLQQHEETHEANGTACSTVNTSGPVGMSGMLRKRRTETPVEVVATPVPAATKTPLKKTNSDMNISAGGKFQCQACEKSFGNEFGLRVHIGCVHKGMEKLPPKNERTPESKPESKSSTAITYTPPSNNSNITTPSGGKFQCHGCDKSFATEFGLRVHIGCVHKGMEKLPPKSTTKTSAPPVHAPKPPPPPVTDSYCELCEKQFDSVTDCGSHMQKHYEVAYTYRERTIRCKECKHESTTRSEFKHHIKLRHKEIYRKRIAGLATMDPKFEACNMCFMPVFYTKIIRHINSHYMRENERRDDSDELLALPTPTKSPNTISKPIKTSPKAHLTHALQHPNGKTIKLKCKTCSKFYPDKSSLMKHMLTFHKKTDGRKHFNCKICFRSITGLQNFNSHMSSHRGDYHPKTKTKHNHACHLCSGVFGEREDLQKHLVVAHSFNPMIFYKK